MEDTTATMRRKILNLEAAMENEAGMGEAGCPLEHLFAPGLYARHILLPAGATIVGKIHKHAHLNFIQFGHVTVATPTGTAEYVGPCSFTSEAGTKRVVVVHEAALWITVHATQLTDIDEIEKEIISPSFQALGLAVADKVLT
jgi:hypothetical protein